MNNMENKFCCYVFVAGHKKGQKCNRFCRSGRGVCFVHKNKVIKKNEDNKIENDIVNKNISKPKIELLEIKKDFSSSDSSSSD